MPTVAPIPPSSPAQWLGLPDVYRMTVDEYERLTSAGALDDPRVELIDGYLVKKMPKYPPHIWTVYAVIEILRMLLPGWWCRKEDPVRIPLFDEPEPDVAVVRGSRDDYRGRIPGPGDIALIVEVSESTLDRDRGSNRRAYAKGGIPWYWIINLVDRQVEVYSDPGPDDDQSCQIFKPGQSIPVVVDKAVAGQIPVVDILP
ncbi:MAG: Uma2 family endonuclease [Isosphaeraceae bacterium]